MHTGAGPRGIGRIQILKPLQLTFAGLGLALFAIVAAPSAALAQAHAHIGHVGTAWGDTPDGMGFLPTVRAEMAVAVQHAGFASQQPDNLDWMKLHAGHVLNAIDPSVEAAGPGLGYGVVAAAQGVVDHVGFAAAADDTSDNIKLHAAHMAASTGNILVWSGRAVALVARIRAANSAAEAAPLVEALVVLTSAMVDGVDADGDGSVSWKEGEGGVALAELHLGFMKDGEGL